jgi:hypothetical protein
MAGVAGAAELTALEFVLPQALRTRSATKAISVQQIGLLPCRRPLELDEVL